MTNKCDSSSGNPTFVVYYLGGGANNTLRQLLWEALVVQFVCCDVWPQPYSSFAVMRGPSHTVRLPLWGPQPNSLFAVMWVFFWGGGALQFAQIMLGLNVPSFQTHPYPSTPSPFFFFSFHFLSFCNSCFLSWRDVFSGHLCKNANFIGIGSLKRVFLKSTLLSR